MKLLYYPTDRAADELDISRNTLYLKRKSGTLPDPEAEICGRSYYSQKQITQMKKILKNEKKRQ